MTASPGPLATRPPADATRAVQDFCAGVLDLLAGTPDGDPVASAVCDRLTGVLAGAAAVAEELRREAATADAAVRTLEALAGSSLFRETRAASVRAELADKSRHIQRFVAALDRLAGPPPDPAGRPRPALPGPARETVCAGETAVYDLADLAPPRPAAEPRVLPAPRTPAPWPARDDDSGPLNLPDLHIPDPDEVPINVPMAGTEADSAADRCDVRDLVRRGERARRTGDLETAEALFGEAIRRDPQARRAFVGRAQIRIGTGDLTSGIADLSAALRLGPDDAALLALRGDASVAERQLAAALRDYTRALDLGPDLPRVRLNRAVVLRMTGETAAALAELDRVIAVRPDSVVAFYNRGLIHVELGAEGLAIKDFESALRLNPRHADARRQLAACRDRLGEAAARPAPPSARTGSPGGPPSSASTKPAPRSTASPGSGVTPLSPPRESVPDPSVSSPAKATVSSASLGTQTDQPAVIDVLCPCCSAPGQVAWTRLANIHQCKDCHAHFAIRPGGGVVELNRTPEGKWVEVNHAKEAERTRRNRRLLTLAVSLLLVVPLGVYSVRRVALAQQPAPEPPLPAELKPRAEAFARAWLAGDKRTLVRLTAPTHDKILNVWLARHRPPVVPARTDDAGKPVPPAVDVSVVPGSDNPARVRVRVPDAQAGSGKPLPDLNLEWEERGGTWSFVPPAK